MYGDSIIQQLTVKITLNMGYSKDGRKKKSFGEHIFFLSWENLISIFWGAIHFRLKRGVDSVPQMKHSFCDVTAGVPADAHSSAPALDTGKSEQMGRSQTIGSWKSAVGLTWLILLSLPDVRCRNGMGATTCFSQRWFKNENEWPQAKNLSVSCHIYCHASFSYSVYLLT